MQVPAIGHMPPSRRACASCVTQNRYLIIHGGFDGKVCLSDSYLFDTETSAWASVEACHQPGPRALHSLSQIGHCFILYGGASNNRVHDTTYWLHSQAVTSGLQLRAHAVELEKRNCHLENQIVELSATAVKQKRQAQSALEIQQVRSHW
jgi:hypothetical protein